MKNCHWLKCSVCSQNVVLGQDCPPPAYEMYQAMMTPGAVVGVVCGIPGRTQSVFCTGDYFPHCSGLQTFWRYSNVKN